MADDKMDPEVAEVLADFPYWHDLKKTLWGFEQVHDDLQQAKDDLKLLEKAYDTLRIIVVPESMKHNGILDKHGKGSCTTPSGRKVYITTDTRAYITKEDEPLAHAEIVRMGFGELIRPTIHPSTLTAWIRQRLEDGEETPPGIQMYQQDKAVLRKS